MIFSCCGPGNFQNCQDLFGAVVTEKGICYSFNPTMMNNSLKSIPYTSMFQTVFAEDLQPAEAVYIENTAKAYSMQIILDSHSSKVIDKSSTGAFTIGINQNDDYMSLIDSGATIETGLHTLIKVTPSEVDSTTRFDEMRFRSVIWASTSRFNWPFRNAKPA